MKGDARSKKPALSTVKRNAWPLFPFGRVTVTLRCSYTLQQHKLSALTFFSRHTVGDWGDVDTKHQTHNNQALLSGKSKLHSIYKTAQGVVISIVTDRDRSTTTILLFGEHTL